MSPIARRFSSSVARGISSGASIPKRTESSRNVRIHWSVCSRSERTGLQGACDGLVVDVGVIHHLTDLVAAQVFQRAAQDVEAHERPEVSDVRARIHGGPAAIDPTRPSCCGVNGSS